MSKGESDAQRQFAVDVVNQLRDAGYQALWAGGCVRDMLLESAPKDYDVATSATPDEVRQVFGKKRTLPIGASFGVITVLGSKQAGQIEVATFRSDLDYVDGRRPEGVIYTTAEHDAQRRDFTINGLFYDPLEDRIVDYVDGRVDIEGRLIRAIGDPAARFAEDKLRMLRAVRFASRFDFAIHSETLEAIQQHAHELTIVSGERIGNEMRRMLIHANRASAVGLLHDTQLAQVVFPELLQIAELATRISAASSLVEPQLATVLATLLIGEEPIDVAAIVNRWKLTNADAALLNWLIERFEVASSAESLPWPRVQRTLADGRAIHLLAIAEARLGRDDPNVVFIRERLNWPREKLDPIPLVTGADLIASGIAPGPEMGDVLEAIRDSQLLGQFTNQQQAIEFAKQRRTRPERT